MRLVVRLKTVSPIFFNVKEAKEQLLKGEVYTLRRKRKSDGPTTARVGNILKFVSIGKVDVEHVKDIEACDRENVGEYLDKSGFPTVEAWCSARAAGANSLYKVSLIK